MQEGRPETAKSAAADELDGSSVQPRSLKQGAQMEGAKTGTERATRVCISRDKDLSRGEGSAGGSDNGDAWSGSISNAADETTGDGHAAVMQEALAAEASAAPSSSSKASEQWAEASHTYVVGAGEADGGWATVTSSRRKVRRQVENAAPASLHRATASAAAALLKPSLLPSAVYAFDSEACSAEAFQVSHDTQVRLRDWRGAPPSGVHCAHII